ncbi:hypothetical protein [Streptomyces klenkii]|nr:hypothetical protein [Streptomyces klenkii]
MTEPATPTPPPPATGWRARITRVPLWVRIVAPIAGVAVLAIAGLLTYDALVETQDEIAAQCQDALDDAAPGTVHADRPPEACEGLTEDNWNMLHLAWVFENEGIFDDFGIDTDD